MIPFQQHRDGVSFAIKVAPRASRNAILGELGEALEVALTAPPVEGKANAACIQFFAQLLEVPRSSVSIVGGESSRNKRIRVQGVSAAQVVLRLGS